MGRWAARIAHQISPAQDYISIVDVIDVIMNYPRAWQKCLNKIQEYETSPIEEWNHYQLLGYVLSQTSQKFEPINVVESNEEFLGVHKTEPNSHPMLECMRYVFRQFDKCPIQTKKFLDWCLSKYRDKLSISGLRKLQFYYKENNKEGTLNIPTRTDELPTNLKKLFVGLANNWGDLSFMKDDDSLRRVLIDKLTSIGHTIESLKLDKIR